MRISDWSSDVCSSDLQRAPGGTIQLPLSWQGHRSGRPQATDQRDRGGAGTVRLSPYPCPTAARRLGDQRQASLPALQGDGSATAQEGAEATGKGKAEGRPLCGIGRATCRERVCQYV